MTTCTPSDAAMRTAQRWYDPALEPPVGDYVIALAMIIDAEYSRPAPGWKAPAPPPFLWCCHVRGPDEVHACADYDDALMLSDQINDQSERFNAGRADNERVMCKASPAQWPWSAAEHAADLAKRKAENEAAAIARGMRKEKGDV